MSEKKRVAFICQFSNEQVRSKLELSDLSLENRFRSLFGHNRRRYVDRVVWVTEFIKGFEKDNQNEYHIISTHFGMKRLTQSFVINGVHYHFIKEEPFFLIHYLNERLNVYHRNFYQRNRRLITKFVDACNPDLVAVCGTENIYYSSSVLDIKGIPVFGILQSLRNNPKLMAFEKNEWLISAERKVLAKCNYFGGGGLEYYNVVKGFVKDPIFVKLGFPQGKPPIYNNLIKENDFIFYAARIGKNKGIEDVLKAFVNVVKKHPQVKLSIAGGCSDDYKKYLVEEFIIPNSIGNNVKFCGFFLKFDDVYREVQKSRFVIVPGISAGLNGTVRESMQMGMPVIVYETNSTKIINQDEIRLLTAKMSEVEDLSVKMIYALEHTEDMSMMAARAKKYADSAFDPDSLCQLLISDFKAIINNYYENIPIPSQNLLN